MCHKSCAHRPTALHQLLGEPPDHEPAYYWSCSCPLFRMWVKELFIKCLTIVFFLATQVTRCSGQKCLDFWLWWLALWWSCSPSCSWSLPLACGTSAQWSAWHVSPGWTIYSWRSKHSGSSHQFFPENFSRPWLLRRKCKKFSQI